MKKHKPTVEEIIKWLQGYNPKAEVRFACGFLEKPKYWTSDYTFCKTTDDPMKAKVIMVDLT